MNERVRSPCIRDAGCHPSPSLRDHLFGPRDTCHEEENQRCRDQQYQPRFAVPDEDRDAEREENDRQQIGHYQQQNIVYCAYVRDSEEPREEAQQDCRQTEICKEARACAPDERSKSITFFILFSGSSAKHTDTEEKGLMQDQHQYRRDEERTVTAGGREERRLMIRGVLHKRPSELLIHTHLFVAVDLDITHGLQHDLVAGEIDRLHIEERRHVAIERYMRLSKRVRQLLGEVTREIDDTVYLLVTQQLLRLRHRGAGVRQFNIRRGVPSMQKLAALRRIAQIDYRNRHIVDLLIPIERLVNQRIRQRGDNKNDDHTRVPEDALKFRDK